MARAFCPGRCSDVAGAFGIGEVESSYGIGFRQATFLKSTFWNLCFTTGQDVTMAPDLCWCALGL